MHNPEWGVMSHNSDSGVPKLLGILCMGGLSILPLFFFFFFSISMYSYLYFRLCFNAMLFVAQIVPSLVIRSSFCWLLCPFDISHFTYNNNNNKNNTFFSSLFFQEVLHVDNQ